MERMQRAYQMIRSVELPTQYPTRVHLPGVVDIHVHVGHGLTDPLDLAKRATQAGIRAIVFKTTSPSLDLAITVNNALAEICESAGIIPTECLGGFVIEGQPPSAQAAERWVRKGAKIVWFGTMSAANHMERAGGMSREAARRAGQFVLNGDRLIPEAEAVLELVAAHDVSVSFGHLSREEMFALAAACERRGIKKAFVDHPFNPVTGHTTEDCVRIASHGVFINLTASEFSPLFGIEPKMMTDAIRQIGIDRTILSSDAGFPTGPDPVESMRLWRVIAESNGFSRSEIDQMTCDNPAYVVGIA